MGALKKAQPAVKTLAEWDRTERKPDGTPKSGWSPFSNQYFDDLPRLLRGSVQWALVCYLVRMTDGLEPDRRDEDWPQWSAWMRWDELAERCACALRTVQEEAHELAERAGGGLVKIQERRGSVRFRLLYQTWGKLPDYRSIPKPVLVVDHKKDRAPILEKPFTVKAGRLSAAIPIPGWDEKTVAFRGGESDCTVSLYLESGSRLLVETQVAAEPVKGKRKRGAEKNQQDTVDNRSGGSGSVASSSPDPVDPKLGFSSPLAEALADYGIFSKISLDRLVEDCRRAAPECSMEDILFAVRKVGDPARRNKNVKSVSGLVLSQAPKYFASGAYRKGHDPEKPTLDELRGMDKKGRAIVERVNALRRARGENV